MKDDGALTEVDEEEEESPVWESAFIGRKLDLASAGEAEHVDYVANLMRCGNWGSGSIAAISHLFMRPLGYLKKIEAEAGRRVTSEAVDRDRVQKVVSKALAVNLHRATQAHKYSEVTKTADVWSKIVGARAPERHEHAVIVAHYDAMSPRNKIRWIDDNIAKLQQKKSELLALADDENDAFEPEE